MRTKSSKSTSRTSVPDSIVPVTAAATDSISDVATRAYAKYENSGYASGNDVQHWLEAESELTPIGENQ